jgi:hypothetical protein
VLSNLKGTLRLIAFLTPLLVYPVLHAQSDSERFAEGRIALDKYHDCQGALTALQQVSTEGQANLMWSYYMGKTEECLHDLSKAVKYYRQFSEANPTPEMTNKIADLEYQLSQKSKQERLLDIYGYWFVESDDRFRVFKNVEFLIQHVEGSDDLFLTVVNVPLGNEYLVKNQKIRLLKQGDAYSVDLTFVPPDEWRNGQRNEETGETVYCAKLKNEWLEISLDPDGKTITAQHRVPRYLEATGCQMTPSEVMVWVRHNVDQ